MESVGIIFIFVGYVIVRLMLGHHQTPTMRDRKLFATLIEAVGKKNFTETLPNIEQALEKKPESAICWALKAQCHLGLREYNQAIFYADKAVNIDPTLYETYHHKGLAYLKLGHYQDALTTFEKAVWYSREQFAEAFYYKGLMLLYLEEDEKAEYAFRQATKLGHELANFELIRLQNKVEK